MKGHSLGDLVFYAMLAVSFILTIAAFIGMGISLATYDPPANPRSGTVRDTPADIRAEQEWEWYERDPLTRGG